MRWCRFRGPAAASPTAHRITAAPPEPFGGQVVTRMADQAWARRRHRTADRWCVKLPCSVRTVSASAGDVDMSWWRVPSVSPRPPFHGSLLRVLAHSGHTGGWAHSAIRIRSCQKLAVVSKRSHSYELGGLDLPTSVPSQKSTSIPTDPLDHCATSQPLKPVSQRFVPNSVPN
jgi:hypothetical protein